MTNNEVVEARVTTEGVAYSSLKERLDLENNQYRMDPTLDIGGAEVRAPFLTSLQQFKGGINQAKFNLLLCTDLHYEERYAPNYKNSHLGLTHVSNAQFLSDKLDGMVLNGDNCQSDSYSLENCKKQYEILAQKFFDFNTSCDKYMVLGNHDDGSGRSVGRIRGMTLTKDEIMSDKDFKRLFRSNERLNGERRANNDSLYCYKDFLEKNIRLIILNSSDIPETKVNPDGTVKWLRLRTHSYSNAQLNWLANEALKNIPESCHVMLVAHCPIHMGWDMANVTHHNHDMLIDLLTAFKNGQKYVGKSSDLDSDFFASVTVDFTMQGKRNLIGFFSGHLHNENNYSVNGINNITCNCSITYQKNRIVDTPSEDALSVIEVDTANKKINIKGFGAVKNRSYTY